MNNEIYAIDEYFFVKDIKIENIYEKSIRWFNKERASIIECEKNKYIKAHHIGWKYDSKYKVKYIIIYLIQDQSNTIITFKIPHIPSVSIGGGYWVHWWPIMYNYCNYIGVNLDQVEEKIEKMLSKEGLIWLKPKRSKDK